MASSLGKGERQRRHVLQLITSPHRQTQPKTARTTQPVFITKKTYSNGHVFYEVLVGGEYYSDVDERELALLQAGMEPSDLGLDPVEGE